MEKMKCPNCGKKFTYEEVNNVVEHIAGQKLLASFHMVILLPKKSRII